MSFRLFTILLLLAACAALIVQAGPVKGGKASRGRGTEDEYKCKDDDCSADNCYHGMCRFGNKAFGYGCSKSCVEDRRSGKYMDDVLDCVADPFC